jgi:hypothetical protein
MRRAVRLSFSCGIVLLAGGCGRIDYDPRTGDVGGVDAALDAPDAADAAVGSDAAPDAAELEVAPANANVNTSVRLVASGGTPPYEYELVTGEADLDPVTGELFTPAFAHDLAVRITDATGAFATREVSVGGEVLFYAAGRDETHAATDDVWRSDDDGRSWMSVGPLPGASYNAAFIVYEDALLFMGGRPGDWRDEVWRSTDGATWTQIGTLPDPRASIQAAVFEGRIWIVGGYNSSTRDDVWSSADGGATWRVESTFPTAIHGGALVVSGGLLRYVGGLNEEPSLAYFDEVWSSPDGIAWNESTDVLPGECGFMGSVVLYGEIILAGGSNPPCTEGVFRSNDALRWSSSGTLPAPLSSGGLISHKGRFLYVGGDDGSGSAAPVSDVVWESADLAAWTNVGTLPAPRFGGGLVTYTPR